MFEAGHTKTDVVLDACPSWILQAEGAGGVDEGMPREDLLGAFIVRLQGFWNRHLQSLETRTTLVAHFRQWETTTINQLLIGRGRIANRIAFISDWRASQMLVKFRLKFCILISFRCYVCRVRFWFTITDVTFKIAYYGNNQVGYACYTWQYIRQTRKRDQNVITIYA